MKRISLQTHSSKLLFACVALGLVTAGKTASAQQILTLISPTVNDGGFESVTAKSVFTSPASATGAIPYWGATLVNTAGATVPTPNDSGAETGAPTTGNDTRPIRTGNAGAFWQPSNQPAAGTAFNLVTTRAMVAGDVFTLTWYGRLTGNGGAQYATLFSQLASTVTGATYTYQPSATLAIGDGATNLNYVIDGTYNNQYTLTYTATAADAGKFIGLTYGNSGTAYIAADDFNLTVQTAVPEPSTYAICLAGLGGILLVRRARRATV